MLVLYKEFKVGELFEPYLPRNKKLDKKERGRHPLICGSGVNNGIDGYTDEEIDVYENELTMSTRGSSGATFYQEGKFVLNNNSMVLKLKEEYSKNKGALIYISTHLNKLPYEGYTSYPTKSGIVKDVLELPVKSLEDTEPDWEYMEEYIKQKELAYIGKLNYEFEQKKEQLIELIGEESEYINIEELPTAKFKVKDLYDNIYRGKRITKKDRVKGDIPLVTAGKEDLGISEYIKGHTTQGVSNTITIDMFGNVFYRDYPYYMDDNIIVLHNEEFSKEHNLYIASTLNYLKEEYSYASQFRMKSLESVKIELPINPEISDLVPDWETMEDYVNGIKHLYLHKEDESHKEKLELLFELTGWTEQDLDNIENLGGAIIKALIDWNAMERYVARIELQLLNRVINTLNT